MLNGGGNSGRVLGRPATTALMIATALLTRKTVAKTWSAVGDKRPPPEEDNAEVDLREAIAWALVSGAAVGVARLLARRLVAYRGTPAAGRGHGR